MSMKKIIILLVAAFMMSATAVYAEPKELSGPRLGLTYITPGEIVEEIDGSFMTQYGWQFETRFVSGEELAGLVEWVLLAGGLEKGYVLPSVTSIIGLRAKSGFEIGAGPNLSLAGVGLVFAVGYNFSIGSLNLPLNLSWVPSTRIEDENDLSEGVDAGHRVSLTFGFNM
tara:strand:+ start:3780 stop:4289 length:510 start_codon:yes stop_codon:yes gene_type:complete